MLKTLITALLALFAAAAFAAVDVNKATQAELESIKGIGPAISGKILDERKKAPFKDWNDMIERVKGVGEHNAARFSTDGLTVNGAAFTGAPAAAKPDVKSSTKADAKAPAATAKAPAALPATPSTPAAQPAATAGKPATAADEKREKAAEKRAAREAEKAEKAEKKAARKSATAASAPASAAQARKK